MNAAPITSFLLLAVAMLTGCNPVSMAISAGSMVGVAAVQERGIGGTADDSLVKARVSEAFFRASEPIFLKVTVRVHDGRVLLTGGLPEPELRARAVALAREQTGVREVIDELQAVDIGLPTYSRDTWIATQINTALGFDGDILSINYSVDVTNGVVYLMGVAQNQAELDRVLEHAGDTRYVKKVVNYVLLKNDPRRNSA